MFKIIIISSLGVATYFASSFESYTLKYVVYTSALIGAIATFRSTK